MVFEVNGISRPEITIIQPLGTGNSSCKVQIPRIVKIFKINSSKLLVYGIVLSSCTQNVLVRINRSFITR